MTLNYMEFINFFCTFEECEKETERMRERAKNVYTEKRCTHRAINMETKPQKLPTTIDIP